MTGFSNYEPDVGRRWLQLLKEVVPSAAQIAVLFDPRTSPYNTLWMRSIEAAAPGFGVSTFQVSVQSDEDIRRAFNTLLTKPATGLIVPSDSFTFERAALIASLATDGRIPAVYAFPRFAYEGGLISYGIDLVEQLGKAAGYVNRILKGERAGDLPVQGPTRYTMTINLKTAKAFGLSIAPGLIASADEVIE
jgi:putative ABC transport system substrate-binding protein